MKTTIAILALIAIIAGIGAVASLIPIHQVNAQSQGPPIAFPNPNAEQACNVVTQTFQLNTYNK